MKTVGIVLFIAGVLMTLVTGFTYVTKEKVIDIGKVEITADNEHDVQWQPYVGLITMVIGGAMVFLNRKPGG